MEYSDLAPQPNVKAGACSTPEEITGPADGRAPFSRRTYTRRQAIALGAAAGLLLAGCTNGGGASGQSAASSSSAAAADGAEALLASMALEQKVAQLVVPAFRTWGKEDLTDLSAAPELAAALRRHQYGGVILFGANIDGTEQTLRLVHDLQANNAQGAQEAGIAAIPYLVSCDQEGGLVARLTMGTRGTSSMAIGATGDAAEDNARETGAAFGEELAALGINVDLAPVADVILDPADPGQSTREFGYDPRLAGACAAAFADGLAQSDVAACLKHFPGAGDGSDYPTATLLSEDELRENGLASFKMALESGADMLMTSATTFPLIDEKRTMGDGTQGFWPATMSKRIVGDILRGELGFEGVVVTDALEMDQFLVEPETGAPLVAGEQGSVEFAVNVAAAALDAGCDILLLPRDMADADAVAFMDDYLAGLVAKVEAGELEEATVDAAVARILACKERHGVLGLDVAGADVDAAVDAALQVVGSDEHHALEERIAAEAVTLLKNEGGALPLDGAQGTYLLLGRRDADAVGLAYAVGCLQAGGAIAADALVENRVDGSAQGSADSPVRIVIDRYLEDGEPAVTPELEKDIAASAAVVCLGTLFADVNLDALQDDASQVQGVTQVQELAQAAGARFVYVSCSLPFDVARYPQADAHVLAYSSSGIDVDPTARTDAGGNAAAFNPNVPAAIAAIFGDAPFQGAVPIDIPALERDAKGQLSFASELLYPRGTGLTLHA